MIKFLIALSLLLGLSNAGVQSSDLMDVEIARIISRTCITETKLFTFNRNVFKWRLSKEQRRRYGVNKDIIFNSKLEALKTQKSSLLLEASRQSQYRTLADERKTVLEKKTLLLKKLGKSRHEPNIINKIAQQLKQYNVQIERIDRRLNAKEHLAEKVLAGTLALDCYEADATLRK